VCRSRNTSKANNLYARFGSNEAIFYSDETLLKQRLITVT
jgi:hypothetical protein